MTRRDLQELALLRLREAQALLDAGMPDGAYYLAGYAVECALKACIARSIQRHEFPDKKKVDQSHTHSLRELMRVAELEKPCAAQAQRDAIFRHNWNKVAEWSEQSRYRKHSLDAAGALIARIDGRHGVLTWIKRHW